MYLTEFKKNNPTMESLCKNSLKDRVKILNSAYYILDSTLSSDSKMHEYFNKNYNGKIQFKIYSYFVDRVRKELKDNDLYTFVGYYPSHALAFMMLQNFINSIDK